MFNKVYLGATPIKKIYLGDVPIKYGSEDIIPENIVAVYTVPSKDTFLSKVEGLTNERYIYQKNDDNTYTLTITSLTPPTYITFQYQNVLSVEYINTTNLTSVSGMFRDCRYLKSVIMPDFVTDDDSNSRYSSMFRGCTELTYVDIRNWDVYYTADNPNWFSGMFSDCTSLEELRLDNWDNITELMRYYTDLPKFTSGSHTIYCKEEAVYDENDNFVEPPQGWVYSFV